MKDELPQPTLSEITITESDVYEGLISLNPVKAMGIDGIGPKILKHCALALFKPIHHLFVLSITKHCLPTEWRFHLIAPVYKSGDKSSVKNYRPISLLCMISKVLIYNKIIPFVSNSISSSQFGFRKKHSTMQQLLVFYSYTLFLRWVPGLVQNSTDLVCIRDQLCLPHQLQG